MIRRQVTERRSGGHKYSENAAAVLVLAVLLLPLLAFSVPTHGIFAGSTDIGVTRRGSSEFDSATVTYRISGGGANMWDTTDAFHFDWQALVGDATLTATVQFPPGAPVPHEKAVLIFRQSLDPASDYADVAVHANGLIALQYRAVPGGTTDDIADPSTADTAKPVTVRIQRDGDLYVASVAGPDGQFARFASAVIALHDPMYVGIGVCAHQADGMATVTFSSVRIDRHPKPISMANID
jgi:TolB protein